MTKLLAQLEDMLKRHDECPADDLIDFSYLLTVDELRAIVTALAPRQEGRRAEVRLNDDKTLDEVVTKDGDQLEQMDYNHWFLQIADVAVWLHSKNAIRASYEHRSNAAERSAKE